MVKTLITALALGSLAWPGANQDGPPLEFRSASLVLEYEATAGEGVILFQGESEESLTGVQVRAPDGRAVIEIRSNARLGLSVAEFRVSSDKLDFAELLQAYPQGSYQLRARSDDGLPVQGQALLSHALPAAPAVIHPTDGSTGVSNTGLTVSWAQSAGAERYRIVLEQNENDGLIVEVPGGKTSLQVPDGLLAPGTRTRLEVAAIAPNGNITSVEIRFRTM